MAHLAADIIYRLDDGRFWDTVQACFIDAEQAAYLAENGRQLHRLINASGPGDEAALVVDLLFYGYGLGEFADKLGPEMTVNLEHNATRADIEAALAPLRDRLRNLQEDTVASLGASLSSLETVSLPALSGNISDLGGDVASLEAELVQAKADVASANASLAQAQEKIASLETALAAKFDKSGGTLGNVDFYVDNYIRFRDQRYEQTIKPASDLHQTLFWLGDKNGYRIARLMRSALASGTMQLYLDMYWVLNNELVRKALWSFQVGLDGNAYFVMPNPPDSDNGPEAATTAWTRARIAAATGKGASTFALNAGVATMAMDGQAAVLEPDDFCAWQPDMLTRDMLDAARQVINDYSMQAIFYGFQYELNGEAYFFSYDLYDQQNIADKTLLALAGEAVSISARNEALEMVKLDLGSDEMLALHKYATKTHKQGYMDLAVQRKAAIANLESASALAAKLAEYGLLEAFEDCMKSIKLAYANE